MWTLEGKTALVTGGGKGIGRAIALALAARGVRVVVTGRQERALGETVGEIAHGGGKARHLAGDVRDPVHLAAAVARAVETFGGLDVVVANAGQAANVPLGGDLAAAEAVLHTNLMGAYYTFHASVPHMKGPGRLLAIGSVLAEVGAPGYAAFAASKAGILGLCRAVAHEVAPKKITCNAIVPRFTTDDGGEVTRSALGRLVEPEEVAALAVFLCSAAGDVVTGQALSV
jgi:NAD(P)-dependent dehydrogenase (short-subunit alcohol dehydrogenase family)